MTFASLLAARNAGAQTTDRPRFEHGLAIDFSTIVWFSSAQGPGGLAVTVSHRMWFAPGIGTVLGVRWVNGAYIRQGNRAEGFVSVGFEPPMGHWRPYVGVELGLSAANEDADLLRRGSPASDVRNWGSINPFYVAVAADPLRLRFGHVVLAALGVTVGTALPDPGQGFRAQLTFARFEWRF